MRTVFQREDEDDLKHAYLRDIQRGSLKWAPVNRIFVADARSGAKSWTGVLVEPPSDLADELNAITKFCR